jgi:hypothetical protein
MDGRAIKSCSIVAMQAEGADIMTIEGVAKPDGTLHPMQAAFKENHGLQCGFCTPGMVMNALDFARSHPNPSDQEVREALEGNLCRCTGYHNIVKSIVAGAKAMGGNCERPPPLLPWSVRASRAKRTIRFLTGTGQYTDDVALPNQAYAAFVRSPHAHAKDQKDQTEKAKKAPGVLADLHRRGPRRGQGGRPALRLADHRRQRPADEGAAASLPRAGQGAHVGDQSRW